MTDKKDQTGKFFVIRDDSTKRDQQDLTQLGPFESEKRAEKAIRDDVEDSLDSTGELELGRDENYGSLYYIVQVVSPSVVRLPANSLK